MNLLERPTSGRVVVDGLDLTALSPVQMTQARRKIGMIFQQPHLLSSRTVAANVALPLELSGETADVIAPRVRELLELVGLSDKAEAYPSELSGGQQQRATIARALATRPPVLLCDEATSALDPGTTRSILDLLRDIRQKLGVTILLITHEMDVVKRLCDEVTLLQDGLVVEQGLVADVFAHPRTALAREFIRSTQTVTLPEEMKARLQPNAQPGHVPLVRLELTGRTLDEPLLSQISRQYGVDISIVSSQLDYVGGTKFGVILGELIGTDEAIAAALRHLETQNVQVEVMGYVRRDV